MTSSSHHLSHPNDVLQTRRIPSLHNHKRLYSNRLPPSLLFPANQSAKRTKTITVAASYSCSSSYPISTTTHQQISSYRQQVKHHINSRNLDKAKQLYLKLKRVSTTNTTMIETDVVLESMLVDAFMKSGRVKDAFWLFEQMPDRNVVTWTSMISGCGRNPGFLPTAADLFVEMISNGICANEFACCAVLAAASGLGSVSLGRQIHSLVVRLGLDRDVRTVCCLIDFYSNQGMIDEMELVSGVIVEPDLVVYSSLITGFCNNSLFLEALRVFSRLMSLDIRPNEHTFASVLTACDPELGEQIHGYMIKVRLDQSLYAATSLLKLYSRNSMIILAKLVFSKLTEKNVVTWTSIISCCLQNDEPGDAIDLFLEMMHSDIKPNEFTFATVVAACGLLSESVMLGKQIHGLIIKLGLFSDDRIYNALVTMYARHGEIQEMEKVFDEIINPDTVSWCSAISGYSQNEFNEEAMTLLHRMLRKGDKPNDYGLSSGLSSCADLTSLDHGRQLHCLATKLGCDLHICVGNALVNMYAKCGSIADADFAFRLMPKHDLMSWNSLIHSYTHLGMENQVVQLLDQMPEPPDESTFIGILSACGHMGHINRGLSYFKKMRDVYKLTPSQSHYACLVDMMGRAGKFAEARHIIELMPLDPDALTWKSLLGSCMQYKNVELGKLAATKVSALDPMDSAPYILLSNLYVMRGEWEEAKGVRKVMDERGVKKESGQSWIEVKCVVHSFVAGDRSHPRVQDVHQMLEVLLMEMRVEGYSQDIVSAEYDS